MHYFLSRKVAGRQSGITYIETIIGIALFTMTALLLYSTYQRVFVTVRASQARVVGVAYADELMEFVRNLPYAKVGTQGGIPSGVIAPVQTAVRSGMTFIATTTVRNIDYTFDGVASGTPNDLSPADSKLVEMDILCTTCVNFRPLHFSTMVSPKDLETASTNGSLFLQVIDSSGHPVSGANVHISNTALSPIVNINDVTATSGVLQIIDAPPSVSSYRIDVSKPGYSSDWTSGFPTTTNPTKPHATVALQAVTQLTFAIDRTATLEVESVSPSCSAVSGINFRVSGSKLLNQSPAIPKYDAIFSTGATGRLTLSGLEWDTYTIAASSSFYDVAGIMPLSPLFVLPGATQRVQLIVVPKSPKSVLITVNDAATGLPVSGAEVTLEHALASTSLLTGRGFIQQTDWSGGSGQSVVGALDAYAVQDGNMNSSITPGEVRLQQVLGQYAASGMLESSTFDTGSISNFYQFNFLPGAQPAETGAASARFQIATGNGTSTWAYLGPDGTPGTYYTPTTTDISSVHSGDRYLRYKMYLSTASSSYTPSISDVQFTFTSDCVPPGQVLFQSLANGSYTLTVSKPGYTTYTDHVVVNASTPWQELNVSLTP